MILGKNKCKSPIADSLKAKNPNPSSGNLPSRSKKKKVRRRKMTNPVAAETATEIWPVRRLFNTCKEVFADCGPGIVPSDEKIQRLRAILDDVKPEGVGLTPLMPYFRATAGRGQRSPPITYLHLYECDKFSIGIFCLPPSGVIPLHNHPKMTVFSKLLFGTMHIKSYDWVVDAPRHLAKRQSGTQQKVETCIGSRQRHHVRCLTCLDPLTPIPRDGTAPTSLISHSAISQLQELKRRGKAADGSEKETIIRRI